MIWPQEPGNALQIRQDFKKRWAVVASATFTELALPSTNGLVDSN